MPKSLILSIIIVLLICFIYTYCIHNTHENASNVDSVDSVKKYTFTTNKNALTIGFLGGVHGNEPSGAHELQHLIDTGYFRHAALTSNTNIKVIPRANDFGLRYNSRYRYLPHMWNDADLNRVFHKNDAMGNDIKEFFKDCYLVVDFHEGWGWNLINPNSLGSTITPSHRHIRPMCQRIADSLNYDPTSNEAIMSDNRKKFTVGYTPPCDIKGTFSCHRWNSNELHILVEISGQNDIQPIHIRRRQVKKVVEVCLGF